MNSSSHWTKLNLKRWDKWTLIHEVYLKLRNNEINDKEILNEITVIQIMYKKIYMKKCNNKWYTKEHKTSIYILIYQFIYDNKCLQKEKEKKWINDYDENNKKISTVSFNVRKDWNCFHWKHWKIMLKNFHRKFRKILSLAHKSIQKAGKFAIIGKMVLGFTQRGCSFRSSR